MKWHCWWCCPGWRRVQCECWVCLYCQYTGWYISAVPEVIIVDGFGWSVCLHMLLRVSGDISDWLTGADLDWALVSEGSGWSLGGMDSNWSLDDEGSGWS